MSRHSSTEDIAANGSGTATGSFTSTTAGCKVATGARTWRSRRTCGSCALDYTITYTGAGTTHTTLNGSICGMNVAQTA
jgi:hypothetical protein